VAPAASVGTSPSALVSGWAAATADVDGLGGGSTLAEEGGAGTGRPFSFFSNRSSSSSISVTRTVCSCTELSHLASNATGIPTRQRCTDFKAARTLARSRAEDLHAEAQLSHSTPTAAPHQLSPRTASPNALSPAERLLAFHAHLSTARCTDGGGPTLGVRASSVCPTTVHLAGQWA
jgi:hypothetical protein